MDNAIRLSFSIFDLDQTDRQTDRWGWRRWWPWPTWPGCRRTHSCQKSCHNRERRHCELAMYAKGPTDRLDLHRQQNIRFRSPKNDKKRLFRSLGEEEGKGILAFEVQTALNAHEQHYSYLCIQWQYGSIKVYKNCVKSVNFLTYEYLDRCVN